MLRCLRGLAWVAPILRLRDDAYVMQPDHLDKYCGTVLAGLHHMNASLSEKNMKTVLVLLLAALLGLSEAEYRRTVSYEGEIVVRWYVSSAIVTIACRRMQL